MLPKKFKSFFKKKRPVTGKFYAFSLLILMFINTACKFSVKGDITTHDPISMIGTWKLVSGTLIENGDTTITSYTNNISFIKIINEHHFAFLQHDVSKAIDSTAAFAAGGGSYALKDSFYTENLEYCNDRKWEAHSFNFTVSFKNDTLTQKGLEEVKDAGISRLNIEKYVKLNN